MRFILGVLLSLSLVACGKSSNFTSAGHESFGLTAQTVRKDTLNEEDKSFWHVREIKLPNFKELNYQTFDHLRSVVISGKKIVIDKDHVNHIYQSFNNAKDIKEFKIYADEVIIKDRLHLPQTNVTIYARTLQFIDRESGPDKSAAIVTTPMFLTVLPGQFEDGKPGLKAGDVSVFVKTMSETPMLSGESRFILKGGNGQIGGIGKAGTNGTVMPVITPQLLNFVGGGRPNVGWPMWDTSTQAVYAWIRTSAKSTLGEAKMPTNGTDGTPGGYPGNPGSGGVFTSNQNVILADVSAGLPGKETSGYPGGAAGSPAVATWIEWGRTDRAGFIEIRNTSRSEKGKDAQARVARVSRSERLGEIKIQSDATWLHPEILNQVLVYVKANYLNMAIEPTQKLAKTWTDEILEIEKQQEASGKTLSYARELSVEKLELQGIQDKLDMQLDYFGNPFGWVPMLSFEVSKKIFEDEVQRALKVLYLADWIENVSTSREEEISALTALKDESNAQVKALEEKFNRAQELLPSIKDKAEQIAKEHDLLQKHLEELDNNLESRAERNVEFRHKVPKWKKFLKVASTIVKVVPAFQPALAAIGTGLDLVTKINPDKPWHEIGEVPGYAKQISGVDWLESQKSWKDFKDRIDFENFSGMSSKEKFAYLDEFYKTLKPVFNGIKEAKAAYKDKEVPRSEIEAELLKLRNEDVEYKDVLAKVEQLLTDQRLFAEMVNQTMNTLSSLSMDMMKGYSNITNLDRQLSEGYQYIDFRAVDFLVQMKQEAEDRLLQYHYNMAMAYEYRTLRRYPGNLNLQLIYDRIKIVAKDKKRASLTQEEIESLLVPFYESQIAKVVSDLVGMFNSSGDERNNPAAEFALSPEEISQLNTKGEVNIDLNDRGIFFESEEQIRLKDIVIRDIKLANVPENSSASLKLKITHLGRSTVMKAGEEFNFTHFNGSTKNRYSWATTYNIRNQTERRITTSVSQDSLLKSLLASRNCSNCSSDDDHILYYTRPGALGLYKITKEVSVRGLQVDLESFNIEIDYDFKDVEN